MVCRLLIAEDEKYLREKVTRNIDWGSHDYIMFEASDGEEALAILQTERIDILVTDMRMPRMDGLELIERAKKIKKDLRVIVISGHAEFELAQASIRLGVEDYLLKPFRSERLLEVVEAARLKLREAEQSRADAFARQLFEDKVCDVFSWLANPSFFIKQSSVLTNNRLGEVLKSGTIDDLNSEIESLLHALDRIGSDRENVYVLLNNIVLSALTAVKEVGFEYEHGIGLMTKHLPSTFDGNFDDLKQWVKSFLYDINGLIRGKQQEGTERLIHEMKEYVDQHYRTGVTLNTLAARFNVSSSYLSKLFYEHVGENFSDYVNNLKSQKAKELLKTTDKRVYEIADYLGFNDAYYFSSWFKRTVGVSPTEYKDSLSLPL